MGMNSGQNPRNARGVDDRSVLRKTATGIPAPSEHQAIRAPRSAPGGSPSDAHARAKALSAKARNAKNCGASGAGPDDVNRPKVNDGTVD